MSRSPSGPAAGSAAGAGALAEAVDKSKEVAQEVKAAAEELAVVHAVLDTKLPGAARDPDVSRAVAHTDELEKRLSDSGRKLDAVNDALEQAAEDRKA